jgi:predicted RNase H-like HicB family nuclease
MLTDYINAAMRQAVYKLLEDGTYFGEISVYQGLWSNAPELYDCQKQLQESLEEWIILDLKKGTSIPVIDGIDLNNLPTPEVEEVA